MKIMKKRDPEPAKINYFFGPCWQDLGSFIKEFWKLNAESINKRKEKYEAVGEKNKNGIMSFKGAVNFISCLFLALFGTISFLIISVAFSIVLSIGFFIVYIISFIAWLIDRLYLMINGIFGACPHCKKKYLIPTYICPSCGAKHKRLFPGKYGAFHRVCTCGKKIPSHFLTGRSKLSAECPYCGESLRGGESVPLYIPIVGGRSAGKTAFITAFTYQFIENVARRKKLIVTHFSDESEQFYNNEIKNDYLNGTTRMTLTENNINVESAKAFSFFVENDKLQPKREIRLYDIDGESFVNNTENEIQLQYEYSQGIILIIDPLTIPTVRNALDSTASEIDKNSVGTIDTEIVINSFINKINDVIGRKQDALINVPVAVVISKADMAGMQEFLNEDMIYDIIDKKSLEMDRYSDIEDAIVRQFLNKNDMQNLVKSIDTNFKSSRYFFCSAIGHVREGGKYNPKGVLEPIEWICSISDIGMKNAWNEQKFGKKFEL
jgi:hypothetical protein